MVGTLICASAPSQPFVALNETHLPVWLANNGSPEEEIEVFLMLCEMLKRSVPKESQTPTVAYGQATSRSDTW